MKILKRRNNIEEAQKKALQAYIKQNLQKDCEIVPDKNLEISYLTIAAIPCFSKLDIQKKSLKNAKLSELLKNMEPSFGESLNSKLLEKNIKDSELYKKAQVNRATYHKVINGISRPGKTIAIPLVFALELSEEETIKLLEQAGIHLAYNNKFDLIIRWCLENEIYDIDTVNDYLFEFDQSLLGSAIK